MGRRREAEYEPAGATGNVYVKPRRGREGVRSVFYRDAAGEWHETTAPSLEAAVELADQKAIVYGAAAASKPFISLVADHLDERRPAEWRIEPPPVV